ncbi:histidine protein methyltransferase 1 homolog [Osmerus eperlanus]|uniref:histidine protein methyltransferase 1 homolog n=1 Tax=Osmerus eperlanus TaxID=29151 RepID=UPI002E122293
MSFSFNFDVRIEATSQSDESSDVTQNEGQNGKHKCAAKPEKAVSSSPAEPVKEAVEHLLPVEPHSLLEDAVSETITIGALPPLHFLNESVFERTAGEREDGESILSRTAAQRSDLISGVYEGGLKVWECTYDLLELVDREGETFAGKRVLDLGCGAGLLGIVALKRGARLVHFQDYNSTVIEQLTLPNVLINCHEGEGDVEESEEEDDDKKGSEKRTREESDREVEEEKRAGREKKGDGKVKEKTENSPPPPKKRALEPSKDSKLSRCRFFSGDWRTYLPLVLGEDPSPKYDIIFTSETIYNTANYPALHDTIQGLLAQEGLVYLATKAHYFGVGGGLHLFETFVEQRGVFCVERLWDMDEGLQRHVVALRFNTIKSH